MTTYENIRRQLTAAVAAVLVATFFIGSAVGPAMVAPTSAERVA